MSAPAGSGSGGKRSAARLAAAQALYEMEITGVSADGVLAEFLARRWPLTEAGDAAASGDTNGAAKAEPLVAPDLAFLGELVRGVAARKTELDKAIAGALSIEGTPLDRMEAILRAILRAGAFELAARADVPTAAVINEYVEIAHAFFDGREPALINGVLDRLARNLRGGNGHGAEKPAGAG